MPAVRPVPRAEPRFRGVFPDWQEARPLRWFFAEELLEARHRSGFPTNAAGADEDVNAYLVTLLSAFASRAVDARVRPGTDPLLLPPDPALSRRERAAWYRVNGDHRLLALGLLDRGDLLRRRRVPWGVSPAAVRDRDLAAGRACYELAANLLEGRRGAPAGLAAVLRKLADDFTEYVHVLGVLATRRWGLGARLGEGELAGLLRGGAPAVTPTAPPSPAEAMDELLDAVSAYRRAPDRAAAADLRARARALGIAPERVGLPAG